MRFVDIPSMMGKSRIPAIRRSSLRDGSRERTVSADASRELIAAIFDPVWYQTTYDLKSKNTDRLLDHFLTIGAAQLHDPNPLFDTAWYTNEYLGNNSPVCAVAHYLKSGWTLRYRPNAFFEIDWYRARHGLSSSDDVLLFYHSSHIEGDVISPYIDFDWYTSRYPASGSHPGGVSGHFCRNIPFVDMTPNPIFDSAWYRETQRDVADAEYPPFLHFCRYGDREGRAPHPLFDPQYYLAQNLDVARSGIPPFLHFMSSGANEGRKPNILFELQWYRGNYLHHETTVNALSHYITSGCRSGCQPNQLFDNDWYTAQHETLGKEGTNPLTHYVLTGFKEGRDPSALFDTEDYVAKYPDALTSGTPLGHFIKSGRPLNSLGGLDFRATDIANITDIPYQIWKMPTLEKDDKVCLFVTFSADGTISSHVPSYLDAINANGFEIILILVTNGLSKPVDIPPMVNGLIVRANHGWDFAAWALALTIFPKLWTCEQVLLTNDSVFGPVELASFKTAFQRSADSRADVVALTDSYQVKYHIMSYFIVLTQRGLRSPAVRRFWESIKSHRDKQEVINKYEIGGLASWETGAVPCDVLFPSNPNVIENPTLMQWVSLLDRGFPFLKVQLIRDGYAPGEGWKAALSKNRPLFHAIEAYFEAERARALGDTKIFRPSPAHWRRFKRDPKLKTFYGSITSTRPTPSTDFALEVPFVEDRWESRAGRTIAVIAHIFHDDLAAELLTYFNNIPEAFDLFISTDHEEKKVRIEKAYASHKGRVEVRVLPNVGRDIAPFLLGFKDVFDSHELILHVHSKKSTHGDEFAPWRSFLLGNLLGSPEIVSSIFELFDRDDMGVVYSQHFEKVRPLLNWGGNFEPAKQLLCKAGAALSRDMLLEFPSGSFFWARSAALKPLLDLDIEWSSFDPEAGQVDGTLAHAIERSILYVAEAAGYVWAKVDQLRSNNAPCLIPVVGRQQLDYAIRDVHCPLLFNRLPSPRNRIFVHETINARTRKDHATSPRLNLLIPSLHKRDFFGGTSTAISVFRALADELPDFDLRMIVISVGLDMESMRRFPEWCLQVGGVVTDEPARVIVDLTSEDRGALPVRRGDVFLATAWWTADLGIKLRKAQQQFFHDLTPLIYLIQDHEANFYPWSTRYSVSEATYNVPKVIAIVNSEELSCYLNERYVFERAYTLRFAINKSIVASIVPTPKERIILFYGRPSVSRNAFELVCAAIAAWQQSDPETADRWRVVSAGETYLSHQAGAIQNLEILGKLELEDYGELLSKASVGISLMLSPHPSYPPLEMAFAGLQTISNAFEAKDLKLRNPAIRSIALLTIESLTDELADAISAAEATIGTIVPTQEITDLPSVYPPFEPPLVAGLIQNIAQGDAPMHRSSNCASVA